VRGDNGQGTNNQEKMKKDNVKLISRRDFLKLAGLTSAGITAGHVLFSDLMAVPGELLDKAARRTGKETWVNTVCRQCPGGCGISVRLLDGIPVYIKGNPHYPVNRGGVCPMAHTSLEVLFNPDRVRNPLVRVGTRDQNRFDEIGWDQALASLQKRLQGLIARGEAHKIALLNGDSSPLMRELCQYWLKTVGSANYYEDEALRDISPGVLLAQGINETPAYDLENCKYLLNFGCNFFEEGKSPVYFQQVIGRLRSVKKEARTTLIHIDSRMNLTAAASDKWIPIRPGTYGALALGIAHVLIADELYDKDFVEKNTFGFGPGKDTGGSDFGDFKAYTRENYYPEKVSQITGVPTETIIKLAEEFGTHKPAAAIGGGASQYTTNGGITQWAIYCLNALVGNIQKKGGVFFTPFTPGFEFPGLTPDEKAARSLALPKVGANPGSAAPFADVSPDRLAEAIAAGEPGLIDTLIIIAANPVFLSRQKDLVVKALKKVENVVVLGTFKDETAEQGTLFLPDHCFLEKTDVSGPLPGLIFSHVGLQQPVVKPLFNTRSSGDVLIETGKALSGPGLFPWKNYAEIVDKRFEVLYNSGVGAIVAETADSEWDSYLNQRGWKFQQYESFASFYRLVEKNGGWWNPVSLPRSVRDAFHNRSGKFEFFSSTLQQHPGSGKVKLKGDEQFLPHYEPPLAEGSPEEFPLILTVSQLLTIHNGTGASQPSMMEMVGIQAGRHWKSWMEVNPETAKKYGLKDRQPAWLESLKGRLQAEVRVFQGICPGVVHIPLGLGHTAYGRFGTGIGVNPTDLMENQFEPLVHIPALNGTRVKVSPASKGGQS
jgi:anaerobic selenocysteine-containing dehydrogenase